MCVVLHCVRMLPGSVSVSHGERGSHRDPPLDRRRCKSRRQAWAKDALPNLQPRPRDEAHDIRDRSGGRAKQFRHRLWTVVHLRSLVAAPAPLLRRRRVRNDAAAPVRRQALYSWGHHRRRWRHRSCISLWRSGMMMTTSRRRGWGVVRRRRHVHLLHRLGGRWPAGHVRVVHLLHRLGVRHPESGPLSVLVLLSLETY